MVQIHSVIGKEPKACVRTARLFDAEMDEFDHTALRRDAFDPQLRRKCSKLLAVPYAFLLTAGQIRLRLNNLLSRG